MLNQVILVGRLVRKPEVEETESRIKKTKITLAVSRSWKNCNGEYEVDFVDVILWKGIAENTAEYCKANDVIGVKGRLQKLESDSELVIVAEKVTFLSSRKEDEE